MAAMIDPTTETPGSTEPRSPQGRRPYHPPRLEEFGDVRDLTLGVTPGGVESGPAPRRPLA